jgi:hypothetical protein
MSYVSYINNDANRLKGWMRDVMHQKSLPFEPCTTKIDTWKETFYKTLVPECDGMTRLLSTGETQKVTTTIFKDLEFELCYENRQILDNPFLNYPPFPSCTIPVDECEFQWNQLTLALKDWMVHWAEISFFEGYMPGRFEHDGTDTLSCIGGDYDGSMCLDFERWLLVRRYTAGRGWFSGCPQAQHYCARGEQNLYPDDDGIDIWLESGGCEVRVNRFVLIHFPPMEATTARDICAIDNFTSSIDSSMHSATSIVTADLSSVVFAAQDLRTVGGNVRPFTGSYIKPVANMCKSRTLFRS